MVPAQAADTPAAAPVTVSCSRASYRSGDPIVITIENRGKESIFLPGCNHFLLERRDGSAWRVTREKHCFWEGYAVEVAPQAHVELTEAADGLEPGTYRIRVDFHTGCTPGKPLSDAACKGQGAATSSEITVTP